MLDLKDKMKEVKENIVGIRHEAEEKNLLDSQEYIEFENFLNAISVMDPTEKINEKLNG